MVLATVKTEGEQAAVAASVAERMVFEIDHTNAGSEFEHAWLGGLREEFRPWWHWTSDASYIWENNYTRWADGFEYSDQGGFTWGGDYKTQYLCMNAFSFNWEECGVYTTKVSAYVCEERDFAITDTYQRVTASPVVTSISPSAVLPGTLLTISGEHFNASGSGLGGFENVNVTIAGATCEVLNFTDTEITCRAPQVRAGVAPVRVETWLGQAGPAELPLVTIELEVYSITPERGSLGGGQEVTITGTNLPVDKSRTKIDISFNGTNSTVATSCAVISSSLKEITCLTSLTSIATLTRYEDPSSAFNLTGGLWYAASAVVGVYLDGDGDELRLVSQGEYNNFGDNQRPGIYLVASGTTGIEYMVPGSDWLSTDGGFFNLRFVAQFYDPVTRSVVARCATYGIVSSEAYQPCLNAWSTVGPTPTDLVSFLEDGSPDYLLIVQTHHWYYNVENSDVYQALESCGGSDAISEDSTYYDYRQYFLVGRCGAGLVSGYSKDLGLEGKAVETRWSIEFQLDPFAYFDFDFTGSNNKTEIGYVFDEDRTPYVEWISRKNGTTAGGTTVQLVGSGFVANATTVQLAGVTCALKYEEIGSYRGLHLCEWDGVDCEGLGVNKDGTKLTCLTGVWDYNGDALDREIIVTVDGIGNALAPSVTWSYMNLWSSTTTWGGNDPPVEGDSAVITYGEYIVLDVSPPELYLLTIQGNLQFSPDVGDLALNCSYIVLHYGRLLIGTADEPFETYNAVITLVGSRNSYELPVYGAKTLAVRTAELFMHGRPRTPWTKLAETAYVGNTTLVLRDETDWEVGDHIFISSTEHQMLQAEESYISAVSADGRRVELTKPLIYEHWGEGWTSEDGVHEMDAYRASVGLLTRNIVVQGDSTYTKKEQVRKQKHT